MSTPGEQRAGCCLSPQLSPNDPHKDSPQIGGPVQYSLLYRKNVHQSCSLNNGPSNRPIVFLLIMHPKFADLPVDKNGPHGNAWGLWGPDDQIGTLNLLTDDVVAQAAKECIQTGQRVSLK